MSKDIKQFIRENEALFWGVKPDEKENISLNDSIFHHRTGNPLLAMTLIEQKWDLGKALKSNLSRMKTRPCFFSNPNAYK